MAKKTIEIRIKPDGTIVSETHGIKGKKCMDYISVLEELLNATVVDSGFTEEYLMTETEDVNTEMLTMCGEG